MTNYKVCGTFNCFDYEKDLITSTYQAICSICGSTGPRSSMDTVHATTLAANIGWVISYDTEKDITIHICQKCAGNKNYDG